MRRFACPLLLLATLTAPFGAWAQADTATPAEADAVPITFITMDGLDVNGLRTRPNGINLTARQKVKFDRLARLERNLLGDLRATAHDVALR